MQNLQVTGRNDLRFNVPSISSFRSSTSLSGRSSMSSGSSALTSTNNPTINVNIYDGTGQQISEYDSAIRVEIENRANRHNQFPALTA
jgi:hypothetical protein